MVYILYKHIGSEMSNSDNLNPVRNFIFKLRALAALRARALCVSSLKPSRKTGPCERNPSSVHLGLCSYMERYGTLLTDIYNVYYKRIFPFINFFYKVILLTNTSYMLLI